MELQLDLALSITAQDSNRRQNRSSDDVEEIPALHHHKHESAFSKRNGVVVGWPPVKSWRKQLCHHNRRAGATNNGGGAGRGLNSMYVKVKMEGVGITRKIDLSIHRSYRTLYPKLIALFGKCKENSEYKLMYQNNQGEWLHARDVPWECFIRSAQRLKLERNDYTERSCF